MYKYGCGEYGMEQRMYFEGLENEGLMGYPKMQLTTNLVRKT